MLTPPPLPDEPLPLLEETSGLVDQSSARKLYPTTATATHDLDDGWQTIFDTNYKAFYFHNTKTKETTWDNPRATNDQQEVSMQGPHVEPAFAFAAQFSRKTGRFIGDPESTMIEQTVDARRDKHLTKFFDQEQYNAEGLSLRAERASQRIPTSQNKALIKMYKNRKDAKRRAKLMTDEEERKRKVRF